MRRTMLVAASFATLACLGACGDSNSGAGDAVVAVPTPSPEAESRDPFAWTDVAYQDYLDAADQLGLRPEVLVSEAGFSSGLNTLCRTTADDMVSMRNSHRSYTKDAGTYSTATYLADEVGLRIGLACPQRMTDWTAAGYDTDDIDDKEDDGTNGDDGVSAVTDEDLARATAEEAAASSQPHSGSEHESDGDTDEDAGSDPQSSGEPFTQAPE